MHKDKVLPSARVVYNHSIRARRWRFDNGTVLGRWQGMPSWCPFADSNLIGMGSWRCQQRDSAKQNRPLLAPEKARSGSTALLCSHSMSRGHLSYQDHYFRGFFCHKFGAIFSSDPRELSRDLYTVLIICVLIASALILPFHCCRLVTDWQDRFMPFSWFKLVTCWND